MGIGVEQRPAVLASRIEAIAASQSVLTAQTVIESYRSGLVDVRLALPTENPIYQKGSRVKEITVLLTGRARVVSIEDGGMRQKFSSNFGEGTVFGECAMSTPSEETYPHTIEALEPCTLLSIDSEKKDVAMTKYPDLAMVLLKGTTKRLRYGIDYLPYRLWLPIHVRLARLLLDQIKHVDMKEGVGRIEELTQEDMAATIGATRESVNKAIHRWKEQGIIKMSRRICTILQVEKLLRIGYPEGSERKKAAKSLNGLLGEREGLKDLVEGVAVVLSRR